MSNPGGGKIRSRRSHPSKKPYARAPKQSIFGKVKDTLSHLTPSWLTNIWTPSLPDAKQEDDVVEPGPHKIHIKRQVSFERLASPIPPEFDDNEQEYGSSRNQRQNVDFKSPLLIPNRRYEPRTSSPHDVEQEQLTTEDQEETEKEEDSASETSVSTSGCSSLVPHVDKVDYKERTERDYNERTERRLLTEASSVQKEKTRKEERRSLWSRINTNTPGVSRPQSATKSATKPSFNVSYFGSPLYGSSNASMSSATPGTSSFYPGKTTFGGSSTQRASAKRRRTSPYEVYQPVKRQMRPKPVNSTSEDYGVTSMTAKRILETLEKMSTPLSDARRIPITPSSLSFTPSGRNASRTPGSSFSTRPDLRGRAPPVYGLRVPLQASIAKNRQPPPTSKPPESTKTISFSMKEGTKNTTSFSPPSSVVTTKKPTSPKFDSPKSGGKMRSRSTLHYSAGKEEEVQEIEQPDLPTNVPLPLSKDKSLPKFSFGLSAPTPSTATSSRTSGLITSTPAVGSTKSDLAFKFASPIAKEQAEDDEITAKDNQQPMFQFSAPNPAPFGDDVKSGNIFQSASPVSRKQQDEDKEEEEKEEEEEDEDGDTGGGLFQPAKQLKTGSCLEVLGIASANSSLAVDGSKSTPARETSFGFGDKFKRKSGSWNCPICMIANDTEDSKCVACGESNPSTKEDIKKPQFGTTSSGFGERFKPKEGSWNCSTCMVNNTADSVKCLACGDSKPGKKTETSTAQFSFGAPAKVTVSSGFGDKFKSSAGSWDCPTCMVNNKSDVSKCVACGDNKPGAKQDSSTPQFSFGVKSSNETQKTLGFGDIFKSVPGSWACPTCMVNNKPEVSKCVSCGESKPGDKQESKTPSFSFGAPSSSSSTGISTIGQNGNDKANTKDSTKTEFKFGANNVGFDKYKVSAEVWECDTCMVQNKTTDHKCVACQAPKPGTQPTLSSPPKAPVTTPLAGLATKIAKASETKSDAPSDSSKLLGFKQSDIAKPSITLGTVTGKDSVAKPGSDTFKSSFTSQKTEPIPAVTTFAFGVQKTNESTGFSFAHNVSGSKSQDKKLDVGGAVDVKVGKVETRGFKFDAGAATSKQSVAPAVNFGVVPPQSGSVSVAPAVNFGVVPPQSGSVSVAGQNIKKEETPASHEVKPAFGFGKPLPSGVNSKVNDAPPNVTITPSAGFVFNAGSTQSNQTAVQPIATGAGGFNFTAVKTEHKNKSDAVPKVANMFGAPSGESTAAGFQATTTSSSIVPSSQKSTSSPFVFGGNNTSTTNSTTTNASTPNASGAGFSFNSAPTGGFNATQLSMFTGASANTNKPAVSFAATGALKIGSPALGNSTSGFGSTSGNFSFGAGATQQSTDVSATSVFPSATPFGQQSANSGALPAFGAGSAPAFGAGTTTGFGSSAGASTFANTNNTSVSTPTQQSATPAPFGGISSGTPPVNMFGAGAFNAAGSQQNTSAASAGGFAFQPNPSGGFGTLGGAAAGTGVFQFGGTNDSAAPQQAPSTFSTPGGSTGNQAFNFTAAGSSPAPFNFSANLAASSNMFSASGTPGARKIKRPVRRKK